MANLDFMWNEWVSYVMFFKDYNVAKSIYCA